VSYVDPTLDRCWTAHEWLSSVDVYRSFKTSVAMNNSSEHRTMQKWHIPSAAAAIHILCRVETRPDLTFSTRPLTDAFYQLEANIGLIDRFLEGLPPAAKAGVNKNHFISDMLPYCLRLLSAGSGNGSLMRPVSSIDLLTKEERAAFDAHVNMLRALGLTYVKEDDENTKFGAETINMRLEPEIDKISRYQGASKSRGDVPHLLKTLLAHATNVAVMRENDTAKSSDKKSVANEVEVTLKTASAGKATASPQGKATKRNGDDSVDKVEKKKIKAKAVSPVFFSAIVLCNAFIFSLYVLFVQNFLGVGAAKAKAARTARKAVQVGFDRSKDRVKLSNTGSGVPLDQVIRFKYQKGFTQAVRLPCNKNDLIL